MIKIKQNPLLHSIRRQVVPERIIQKDPTLRDSKHSRGWEYQRIKKKKECWDSWALFSPGSQSTGNQAYTLIPYTRSKRQYWPLELGNFSIVSGFPMHCRMFNSTCSIYPVVFCSNPFLITKCVWDTDKCLGEIILKQLRTTDSKAEN